MAPQLKQSVCVRWILIFNIISIVIMHPVLSMDTASAPAPLLQIEGKRPEHRHHMAMYSPFNRHEEDLGDSKDPCKARLFLGDIALDDHDVDSIFGETVDELVDSIGPQRHLNPFENEDEEETSEEAAAVNLTRAADSTPDQSAAPRNNHQQEQSSSCSSRQQRKRRQRDRESAGDDKQSSSPPTRVSTTFGMPNLAELSDMVDQETYRRRADLLDVSRDSQRRAKQAKRRNKKRCNNAKRNRKQRYRSRNQRTEKVFKRVRRAATAIPERVWPHGVIPYFISANFTGGQKAIFKQAMRHWENHTCISFIEHTDEEAYIKFTSRPCGCCSYVGRRGGRSQAISIGKNCDKFGIVVHELGHVIGFWHEHTRPDRDEHIQILYQNIQEGQEYNFNKMGHSEINSLGEKYDYYSIMHYSRNTFSRGKFLDTILPNAVAETGVRPSIGQRTQLSKGDVRQANKLYRCPACGRTLQATSGNISSANGPEGYQAGLRCIWRINVTPGEKIIIRFHSIGIFKSKNCYYDHLEIRDGHWHRSPLIGRYCGRGTPNEIVSQSSRLWIRFQTISTFHGTGFQMEYEAVCGGVVNKDYGELRSPNYPEEYAPSKECVWQINVAEGFTIGLVFHEFKVEEHDACSYDYLEVRDGPSETSELIGKFCGYELPPEIESTSNSLWVKFNSDASVNKAGVAASFFKEWDECAENNGGCDQLCVNTLGSFRCDCNPGNELSNDGRTCESACGGYVTASEGEISSPNWPQDYPINKQCTWQVVAPPQHKITVDFEDFEMEGDGETCKYDYLQVQSGLNGDTNLHGKFCGDEKPSSITSTVNEMRIVFVSDDTVASRGFRITYHFDRDECAVENGRCGQICTNTIGSYYCSCRPGYMLQDDAHECSEATCEHEIESHVGTLSSPNWPNRYSSGEDCTWHISTVAGHRIKVMFNEFDLESQPECEYDHVDIYDGGDMEADRIGRFCGNERPEEMVTSGNEMFIKFESDKSVQKRGFRGSHTTVCGGELTADSTERLLYSHPQYGETNYIIGHDCNWIIAAPANHNILLTPINFHIEEEKDCSYDYVEIFDGETDEATRFGRFCGEKIQKPIRSNGSSLLIHFRSDDTINRKGFNFTYTIVPATSTVGRRRVRHPSASRRRRRRRRLS